MLADSIIAHGDDRPSTGLHGAYAIRRHRSLADARAFLLRAEAQLENNATFQYTLACYEGQLRNLSASNERLTRAFALNAELKKTALEDEDLWPI